MFGVRSNPYVVMQDSGCRQLYQEDNSVIFIISVIIIIAFVIIISHVSHQRHVSGKLS